MSNKVHVHNHGTQNHSIPGSNTVIKPGANHIDAAVWESAKSHKVIGHHIKEKTLEEKAPTAAEKKEEKAADKADAKK